MRPDKFFKNTVSHDFFALFCGERLGDGIGRAVYAHAQDEDLVLKFETRSGSFQNIIEWETWQEVQDCKYAKHFAPCVDISHCGTVLIMKRTRPLVKEMLPKRMPEFLCDFKVANYGLLDGKLVCHDYGFTLLMTHGLSKKTRKADWYE
jgi:hypothetical protein